MQADIVQNIIDVKNKIIAACETIKKPPNQVTLVAVSKKKDIQMIKIAMRNGIYNFGENYAQELQSISYKSKKYNLALHWSNSIK